MIKEQHPITVEFLKWQDSNIGQYIEYKIRVTFHEGHGTSRESQSLVQAIKANKEFLRGSTNVSQSDNQWDIYKRYSNFVDLSEVLMPFYQAEGVAPAKLPPKIANKNNS